MKLSHLKKLIWEILPDASFETDNDGQVIIYTGVAPITDGINSEVDVINGDLVNIDGVPLKQRVNIVPKMK